MYGYEAFDMKANHIDQAFRIRVPLPVGYDLDTAAELPLMYVTDADLTYGLLLETANER